LKHSAPTDQTSCWLIGTYKIEGFATDIGARLYQDPNVNRKLVNDLGRISGEGTFKLRIAPGDYRLALDHPQGKLSGRDVNLKLKQK
jgi:hypothetical protein